MAHSERTLSGLVESGKKLTALALRLGPLYAPGNPALALANIDSKVKLADKACESYLDAKTARKEGANQRRAAFTSIDKFLSPLRKHARAYSLSADTLNNLDYFIDKMRGERRNAISPPPEAGADANSVAQTSYDSLVTHFEGIVALLATQPSYTPTEPQFTLSTLQTHADQLATLNDNVIALDTQLSGSQTARDLQFFQDPQGLIPLCKAAKSYLLSILTKGTPDYREASRLRFYKPTE